VFSVNRAHAATPSRYFAVECHFVVQSNTDLREDERRSLYPCWSLTH
jgi:hypothetical protein